MKTLKFIAMKKNNFALLALAILILGSCSQDETLVENPAVNAPIEFGIYSGKATETRAGITTDQTIKGTDANAGFGVIAGYNGSYDDFMWNQQVTYVESSESWTYDPVKYWPTKQDDYLSFYAYAPYQDNHSSGDVIEFWEEDPDGLFIQYNHQDPLSNNVDFVAARGVVENIAGNMSKSVMFNFKHELTRLSLYASSARNKTKIVITDVRLVCGDDAEFWKSATYRYAQSDDEDAVGTWDGTGNIADEIGSEFNLNSVIAYDKTYKSSDYPNGIFILENSTPVNLCGGDVIDATDDTKKYVGNHLFLIPALRGNGETGIYATDLKLKVAYEIDKEEVIKTVPITFKGKLFEGKLFEQGKAYTFNIIFGVNDEVTLGADAMD